MGSRLGVMKIAAGRVGVALDVYLLRCNSGLKFCCGCRAWHYRLEFNVDRSRYDGLHALCRHAQSTAGADSYSRIGNKTAKRRWQRKIAAAPLIGCACGCGQQRPAFDGSGRAIKYINGHEAVARKGKDGRFHKN
jgi:hypothetical protein